MSTLTLELDPALAAALEASALREHKPLSAWARERLCLAAMEATAEANGYPPGWLRLFASVDDEAFTAPVRTVVRDITPLNPD